MIGTEFISSSSFSSNRSSNDAWGLFVANLVSFDDVNSRFEYSGLVINFSITPEGISNDSSPSGYQHNP